MYLEGVSGLISSEINISETKPSDETAMKNKKEKICFW